VPKVFHTWSLTFANVDSKYCTRGGSHPEVFQCERCDHTVDPIIYSFLAPWTISWWIEKSILSAFLCLFSSRVSGLIVGLLRFLV
jgi:hypothetical protein